MNILEIKNLSLAFSAGGRYYEALHNVNLSLNQGEMLAIVGESGCGKTITAMSVLKLLSPNAQITSGEILYKGENILEYSETKMRKIRGKEIALIPQDPLTSLNPLYTIGSQIEEVIKEHQGIVGKQARIIAKEVLDEVQIADSEKRLNSYPHELSGGMRQRVIIAMAIACKSNIIICDEATTALDVTVQAQITELLKEIQRTRNTAFIFISHDFGLVHKTADKTAVMYAGRVIEYANTKELFKNPKHPYTKALIKALPDFNSKKLEAIEGQPPSIKEEFNGCSFEPRCTFRKDICKVKVPPCIKSENSDVLCWLYN